MQENETTQKLGKGFGYIAWILALAALTYFFTGVLERKEYPNQQLDTNQTNSYQEVILKDNQNNHYVFTGKINQVQVTFLVDTGATDVALSESLANKLNLVKGRSGIATTANGNTRVYHTNINELKIGEITLHNVDASIVTGMAADDSVLLGMSALKNLEMTHRNGELTLRQYY
ncbi:MAG: retroviral-like aspartic protease family protein [Saccharospirillaceae bacterium]|nr:TIGR02281 family clan AA aspartic protease [Pseudomonadales bacterium]NRB79846.1 retroviral-like aspartic protease family protein [Saccharospirillaceae bacterium]